MTYAEALDRLAGHPHIARYRELCEDSDPDRRDSYRGLVIRLATKPHAYPSLATQAGNALGAVAKVVGRVVTGRKVIVPAEEQAHRLAICETCPNFDAAERRCYLCGCEAALKTRLESEHCPASKW